MSDAMQAEIPAVREGLAAAPDRVAHEMADFSDEQMAYCQDEPVWARWSAETQLRHMACVPCRWLHGRCRDLLLGRGYRLPPVDMEAIQAGTGRHVPPEVCPDREALIAFMRPLFGLCLEILDREKPENLRALTCLRWVDPEAWREDSPERPIDFWRMAAKLHPFGVREDPERPGNFTVELGAVLRQMHWEILAHLRTVQRLKGLLGLPVRVRLPREGYLTIPKFYD